MIETIDNIQQLNETLAGNNAVLLEFFSERCGYCKSFATILEEYANEHPEELTLITLDAQKHQDLANEYNIHAVPALFFIKDGEQISSKAGAMSKDKLHEWIESLQA